MRIMTYNIQSGRNAFGNLNTDCALGAIKKFAPDILGLNEIRVRTADIAPLDQAAYLSEKLGMHMFFAKAIDYLGGDYGVALLSKYPILEACAIPVPPLPEEKRERRYEDRVLLKAKIDCEGRKIGVYVSHYGLSDAERVNAAELTLAEIQKEKDPAIFMGDLNMTPDDPLIKRLSSALTDTAMGQVYRTHHALSLNEKIDYIFVKGGFEIKKTFAPYTQASDHLPVIADVRLL